MELQQKINLRKNKSLVGTKQKILVDMSKDNFSLIENLELKSKPVKKASVLSYVHTGNAPLIVCFKPVGSIKMYPNIFEIYGSTSKLNLLLFLEKLTKNLWLVSVLIPRFPYSIAAIAWWRPSLNNSEGLGALCDKIYEIFTFEVFDNIAEIPVWADKFM